MDSLQRRRLVSGGTLIVIGLALFLAEYLEDFDHSAILLLLGTLFLGGYLYTKNYGLLVPGCILLGVGVGWFGRRSFDLSGDFAEISIGVGFIAIYVIALIYERRSHWWPLIPGTVMILIGLDVGRTAFDYLFERGWPLVLVAIGLFILFGSLIKKQPRPKEPPREPGP